MNDVFKIIESHGYFEFGSVISNELFRMFFAIDEIEYPAMRKEIENQQLNELSAADFCRNKLLNEGKYFKKVGDTYRVLLPSENAQQVLSYMKTADAKLKRGIKLNDRTPTAFRISSNDEARLFMKLK
jgi:hypothetical protein